MTKLLKPDICVIGAGSGGLSVAAAAAAFGAPVVLIEKGKMGGDCLNHGCVPSKALIAAARRAHDMRHGLRFGVVDAEPQIDFRQVHNHVRGVISAIAPNDSVERFTALGVRVIQEEARFKDHRTIAAGVYEIRARRFVIATGSSPLLPLIPGVDEVEYLTNETIFDGKRLPGRLIVIGAGPMGLELAQAYRRLGSEVAVIEAQAALGNEDPELARIVLQRLRAEGVDIRENASATRVERRGRGGVRVYVETAEGGHERIEGTHLLLAAGRAPNVDGLGLEAAGIEHSPDGVKVDDRLRTTNRRVYAIGDVTGGPQFTHAAGYHAGLVIRSILFRLPAREDRRIIPRVTFTDPELAHIGLTEEEARQAHGRISIQRWPLAENDRAHTERETTGFIKLVVGKRGAILGASIVGAGAGDMIHIWALALSKRMKLGDMVGYVAPYPTRGEIGKRAAIAYFSEAARKALVRRLISFLRAFG